MLVERGAFDLSSATLRNELVRLEELGFLRQPHTSAGRVPTDAAYRCYVDLLLESRRPSRSAAAVEAQLVACAGEAPLMDTALASVSHVLSTASHHLGFAIVPTTDQVVFHRIDFVHLGGQKVLVVVVERGGRVTNKAIDVGEPVEADQLRQAANYLNEEFAGLSLADVRTAVGERIAWERGLYGALLRQALRLARAALDENHPRGALFVEGAASLHRGGRAADGRRVDGHPAHAGRDGRGEGPAAADADRVHRRPGTHGGHRSRARLAGDARG